jgi:hypothetical protein
MNTEFVEIDARFCGPPNSGNGGYVCGLVARHLAGPVTVRLKTPPPLQTTLRREWTTDAARLWNDATVIAEAKLSGPLPLEPPSCPTWAQAEAAAADFPGFRSHLFPRCFVCGPARAPGDGLRIFSGPLPGRGIHAAPWVPDASLSDGQRHVASEFIWSALDCPSGFAVLPAPEGLAIVLGELSAWVQGAVAVGEPTVVTSWPIGHEGRRRIAGAAIQRTDGSLVAIARAVWLEVPHRLWAATT